jgi:translation initiation factor 3 subunit H
VTIRTSALASAFLNILTAPTASSRSFPSLTKSAPLPPDFSHLDLGLPSALNRNLEQVVESLEAYRNEENNVAYLSRQITREKARADTHIARRKEENAIRTAQGLPTLPEEDISRLFKIPPEPNRLESMLLLGQVDASARNVEEVTSAGLIKIYAANPAAV